MSWVRKLFGCVAPPDDDATPRFTLTEHLKGIHTTNEPIKKVADVDISPHYPQPTKESQMAYIEKTVPGTPIESVVVGDVNNSPPAAIAALDVKTTGPAPNSLGKSDTATPSSVLDEGSQPAASTSKQIGMQSSSSSISQHLDWPQAPPGLTEHLNPSSNSRKSNQISPPASPPFPQPVKQSSLGRIPSGNVSGMPLQRQSSSGMIQQLLQSGPAKLPMLPEGAQTVRNADQGGASAGSMPAMARVAALAQSIQVTVVPAEQLQQLAETSYHQPDYAAPVASEQSNQASNTNQQSEAERVNQARSEDSIRWLRAASRTNAAPDVIMRSMSSENADTHVTPGCVTAAEAHGVAPVPSRFKEPMMEVKPEYEVQELSNSAGRALTGLVVIGNSLGDNTSTGTDEDQVHFSGSDNATEAQPFATILHTIPAALPVNREGSHISIQGGPASTGTGTNTGGANTPHSQPSFSKAVAAAAAFHAQVQASAEQHAQADRNMGSPWAPASTQPRSVFAAAASSGFTQLHQVLQAQQQQQRQQQQQQQMHVQQGEHAGASQGQALAALVRQHEAASVTGTQQASRLMQLAVGKPESAPEVSAVGSPQSAPEPALVQPGIWKGDVPQVIDPATGAVIALPKPAIAGPSQANVLPAGQLPGIAQLLGQWRPGQQGVPYPGPSAGVAWGASTTTQHTSSGSDEQQNAMSLRTPTSEPLFNISPERLAKARRKTVKRTLCVSSQELQEVVRGMLKQHRSTNSTTPPGIDHATAAQAPLPSLELDTLNVDGLERELFGLALIGRGGGGAVFRAVWQGAQVAVKFMLGKTPASVSLGALEGLLAASVNHPNVVQTYGFDVTKVRESSFRMSPSSQKPPETCLPPPSFSSQVVASIMSELQREKQNMQAALRARPSMDGGGPHHSSSSNLPGLSADNNTVAAGTSVVSGNGQGSPGSPAEPPAVENKEDQINWGLFNSDEGFGEPAEVASADCWSMTQVMQAMKAQPGMYLTYIIMEYCDRGTLLSALQRGVFSVGGTSGDTGRFNERVVLRAALRTARDVARGMQHLHMSDIIHGDLKPGNVLLRGSRTDRRGFIAKVADFGLSKVVTNDAPLEMHHWSTVTHMAPEAIQGTWCRASDVYSFGVLLWQLMCGEAQPYKHLTVPQVITGVSQGWLHLPWPKTCHPAVAKLGAACMVPAHEQRPTFQEIGDVLLHIEQNVRNELRWHAQERQVAGSGMNTPTRHSSPLTRQSHT